MSNCSKSSIFFLSVKGKIVEANFDGGDIFQERYLICRHKTLNWCYKNGVDDIAGPAKK